MSSLHRVEVIPVKLTNHPNADLLGVNSIFDGGYQCVGNLQDWQGKTKTYFIPPDNLVPVNRPEFSFLSQGSVDENGYARIKARRLRGIVSYGLMVPAPDDAEIGMDATELLGVKEYVRDEDKPEKGPKLNMGETCGGPPGVVCPKYDVEDLRKWGAKVFIEGEPVVIREKIDGQNVKFCWQEGQMYCGSRTNWKREYPSVDHLSVQYFLDNGIEQERAEKLYNNCQKYKDKLSWVWQTKDQVLFDYIQDPQCSDVLSNPIDRFCQDHPGDVLFGESYGNVGGMRYGLKNGILRFAAFDIYRKGKWVDSEEFASLMADYQIPTAPYMGVIEYNFSKINELCDGMSLLCPTQIKEGVVVTSLKERWNYVSGRAQLKCVSPTYSEKKK